MFSLQKLLGKEDKFFTLLEASAEQARAAQETLWRFREAQVGRGLRSEKMVFGKIQR